MSTASHWKSVPLPVWYFAVGGYQVMKKRLSYRKEKLLGRALTLDELDYLTAMARRLAALVLQQSKLDENYHAVAAKSYLWQRLGGCGQVTAFLLERHLYRGWSSNMPIVGFRHKVGCNPYSAAVSA